MRTTTIVLPLLAYFLLPLAGTFAAEGILDDAEMANLPGEITNSIGMNLKLIPAGEFMMGSPGSEALRTSDEGPQHRVRITRPFYFGIHEVTVGQFGEFVRSSGYKTEAEKDGRKEIGFDSSGFRSEYSWQKPGFAQANDHPVVYVSWNDAVEFCNRLSKKEGQEYRLPTEAEWEYSCRAGATTCFSFGNDVDGLLRVGNVADATLKEQYENVSWPLTGRDGYVFTSPTGSFQPNDFGLYDMHGNVFEWCEDRYGSS